MKNVLKVENITMQFGGVVAVDNLSLEVNEGEIVALLDHIIAGENGVVSYSENLRRFPPLHPDTFSPYYA